MAVLSRNAIFTKTEHFDIRIEYNEDFVIIHFARLDKITKGVLADLQFYLDDFYDFVTTAGYTGVYAAVEIDDKLMNKLVLRFNFKYLGMSGGMRIFQYKRSA